MRLPFPLLSLIVGAHLFTSVHAAEVVGGSVKLRNEYSKKCLQPLGDSKTTGARAVQASCVSKASQIYQAVVRYDGSYSLKNQHSGLCLQVLDQSVANGASVNHAACDATLPQQRFTPSFVRAGSFALIAQHSGSCVDIPKNQNENTPAHQWKCHLAANQGFYLDKISGALPHVISLPTDATIVDKGGPALPTTLKGINLGGLESGNLTDANRAYWNYAPPSTALIDYMKRKGFTVIRLTFKGKRLQPKLGGPLDLTFLKLIDGTVQYARSKGIIVMLDPHDYGHMADDTLTSQLIGTELMPAKHLANFWSRLAFVYRNQPNVWFNIINEPNKQNARMWQSSAISAISAIRSVGAKQKILIPGTSWTGAHSWIKSGNGKVWAGFHDPNYLMEVHQYLDDWSKGTGQVCIVGNGSKTLVELKNWLVANKKQAFLGEFGWDKNAACMKEGEAILEYMRANANVFAGWTYFGAAYYKGFMTVNPENLGLATEIDKPQMGLLEDYN